MMDSTSLPSRQLHRAAGLARWALGLTLAAWLVLLAIWGALHGIIVPRIGEWREQVEHLASNAIGVPVRIANITARSDGLFPTLELHGLAILDGQNRAALQLQRVVVTISPRSIVRGRLEQLYIHAFMLDVRRLADGRWQVAGLDVTDAGRAKDEDSPVLRWLLKQPEVALRHGTIHFVDEQYGHDAIALHDVNVVLHGGARRYRLQLDAIPTYGRAGSSSGQRLHLAGAFRQPLLPSTEAPWQRWNGQWYALVDLQQLPLVPWLQTWGISNVQGAGQIRMWADVRQGHMTGVTADVALTQAQVSWRAADSGAAPDPLALRQLQGRLALQWRANAWAVQGERIGFIWAGTQQRDEQWLPSSWTLEHWDGDNPLTPDIRLSLEHANLALAATLARSLPVAQAIHEPLARWQPAGHVRQLQVHWQGSRYRVSGQVVDVAIQAQPIENDIGIPGVQGLDGSFQLNEKGGSAQIQLHNRGGILSFPGVFEEPDIHLQQLQAQLQWTLTNGQLQLQVPQAAFRNADTQGNLQASWRMGDQANNRLPGILELRGVLNWADGTRIHRYLPLEIPADTRHYVRDSIRAGMARNVQFEVRGDLLHIPFDTPGTGRFYIEAPLHDIVYDYAPASIRPVGHPPWPALQGLAGILVFEGAGMQVRNASTRFVGQSPQLRMTQINARIPDLSFPRVQIKAQGHGPLADMLTVVTTSPLHAMMGETLSQMTVGGNAVLTLELELPVDDIERATVRGHVALQGNALQFNPDVPLLRQVKGVVQFHEQGFMLRDIQAQALGGSVQISGGMRNVASGVQILAQGDATAQGLQTESPLSLVRQIAHHASGSSRYSVDIAIDTTASNAIPQIHVRSDLQGMALHLPAPLDKTADTRLPLHVFQGASSTAQAQQFIPSTTVTRLTMQDIGSLEYTRDAGTGRVHRGLILAGDVPRVPLPFNGVQAVIHLPELDMDAWLNVLADWQAIEASEGHQQATLSVANTDTASYLPSRINAQVRTLRVHQRTLEQFKAELTQTASIWQGQLQASHFSGYVRYHPPGEAYAAGLVFARLQYLHLPKADVQQLETSGLTTGTQSTLQANLPALDIEVERLEVADRTLGQLQLLAHNQSSAQGRNWILERFNLGRPGARWQAHGHWNIVTPGHPRHTQLSFSLEMDDVGQLLQHFGMPGIIEDGKGQITGQISWQGSPIAPNWQSMAGRVHLDIGKGQFLKVEPGMGKLLSVLSLQSITRRMTLDFRDIFNQGFAFDFVRGDMTVAQGLAHTSNLQMKGLNAAVLLQGYANLSEETQNLHVVVVPEINAMTASLAATVVNPLVGLGSFFAQMLLRGPAMEAATRAFTIYGSWSDPVVVPVVLNESLEEIQKR